MEHIFGSYFFLGFVCIFSIILSMAGLWLTRQIVSHEILMNHHDVAGAMLSVVGSLYAVVLGLVVVGSISKFDQARNTVEQESNSLRNIFYLSEGLKTPLQNDLQKICTSYARAVCKEEWKLMSEGKRSKNVDILLAKMTGQITKLHPDSQGESNLQQALLTELSDMINNRAFRTVLASANFEPILWGVLIFGGVTLVLFTYFFGVENLKLQLLMTGIVTLVLALNMIIVAMFAYPFSGDVKVSPNCFESDLQIFEDQKTLENSN